MKIERSIIELDSPGQEWILRSYGNRFRIITAMDEKDRRLLEMRRFRRPGESFLGPATPEMLARNGLRERFFTNLNVALAVRNMPVASIIGDGREAFASVFLGEIMRNTLDSHLESHDSMSGPFRLSAVLRSIHDDKTLPILVRSEIDSMTRSFYRSLCQMRGDISMPREFRAAATDRMFRDEEERQMSLISEFTGLTDGNVSDTWGGDDRDEL